MVVDRVVGLTSGVRIELSMPNLKEIYGKYESLSDGLVELC